MRNFLLTIAGLSLLGLAFYAGRVTAFDDRPDASAADLEQILPADFLAAVRNEKQREAFLQVWPQVSGVIIGKPENLITEAPETPFPEDFPKSPFALIKTAPDGVGFPDTGLIDGGEILEVAKGGWVIMNVWASWCSPCIVELPDIANAIQVLDADNVSIHVVNADPTRKDTVEKARSLMAERNAEDIPFMFVDGEKNISAFTGAIFEDPDRVSYPYTVIYAPGGEPFAVFSGGPVDDETVWASDEGLAFFRALPTLETL